MIISSHFLKGAHLIPLHLDANKRFLSLTFALSSTLRFFSSPDISPPRMQQSLFYTVLSVLPAQERRQLLSVPEQSEPLMSLWGLHHYLKNRLTQP